MVFKGELTVPSYPTAEIFTSGNRSMLSDVLCGDEMYANGSVTTGNASANSTITLAGNVTATKVRSLEFNDYLWIYFAPVIFVVGVCGNSLTLAVMTQKRLRGTTTSVYMPVIAIFDTLALITGVIPEWLEACRFLVFNKLHPWTCKFEKFSFYTLSDIAIWTLVLFTLDRVIAVCFPLKKSIVCVPRRAIIACGVLAGLCASKNFHVFWTRGREYKPNGVFVSNCGRPQPYTYFEMHVRPWIAFTVVNLLPFVILMFSNSAIIFVLAVVRAKQHQNSKNSGKNAKTFSQTTMMCLSASFAFLVCVTPSMVTLIGRPYWLHPSNAAYDVAKAINNQLGYLNHAINFFLYCLTGQKFRRELVYLLCRKRSRILLEEQQTWQTYLSDARNRPMRKGVARGLDSVNYPVIRPLAPTTLKAVESEF